MLDIKKSPMELHIRKDRVVGFVQNTNNGIDPIIFSSDDDIYCLRHSGDKIDFNTTKNIIPVNFPIYRVYCDIYDPCRMIKRLSLGFDIEGATNEDWLNKCHKVFKCYWSDEHKEEEIPEYTILGFGGLGGKDDYWIKNKNQMI